MRAVPTVASRVPPAVSPTRYRPWAMVAFSHPAGHVLRLKCMTAPVGTPPSSGLCPTNDAGPPLLKAATKIPLKRRTPNPMKKCACSFLISIDIAIFFEL